MMKSSERSLFSHFLSKYWICFSWNYPSFSYLILCWIFLARDESSGNTLLCPLNPIKASVSVDFVLSQISRDRRVVIYQAQTNYFWSFDNGITLRLNTRKFEKVDETKFVDLSKYCTCFGRSVTVHCILYECKALEILCILWIRVN